MLIFLAAGRRQRAWIVTCCWCQSCQEGHWSLEPCSKGVSHAQTTPRPRPGVRLVFLYVEMQTWKTWTHSTTGVDSHKASKTVKSYLKQTLLCSIELGSIKCNLKTAKIGFLPWENMSTTIAKLKIRFCTSLKAISIWGFVDTQDKVNAD